MKRPPIEAVNPAVGNTVDATGIQTRRLSHFVVDAAVNAQEAAAQGGEEKLGLARLSGMIALNGLRERMLNAGAKRAERKMESYEFKTAAKADAAKRYLGMQNEDPASMKALLNNHGRGVLSNYNPYRPTSTKGRIKLQKRERKQRKLLAEQGISLYMMTTRGKQLPDDSYQTGVTKTPIMTDRPQTVHDIEHGYDKLVAGFDDPQGTTRKHNLSRSERRHLKREKELAVEIFEENKHFAHKLRDEAESTEPDSTRYRYLRNHRLRLLERASKHETKGKRRKITREQNAIYAQLMSKQRQHDRKERKDYRAVGHEQSTIYADYLRSQREFRHKKYKAAVAERRQERREQRAQKRQERADRKAAKKSGTKS